jgi:hypothetical protein
MNVSAYFFGFPGEALDKAADAIFKDHDGRHVGSGTMLVGAGAGERDVQYDIHEHRVESCRAALKKAGFRLEPTRDAA